MHRMKRVSVVTVITLLLAGLSLMSISAQVGQDSYSFRNVKITGTGFIPGIIFNESERDSIYARTDMGGVYRWNPGSSSWIPLLDWVGWDDWGLTGGESVATDPVDPDRLYIAAGTYTNSWDPNNGSILRSTDRGNTFARTQLPFKLGGNMPGRSMGERLVIDPNSNNILYLGARSGNGLWKSTNYGVSWAKVTSFPTAGNYIQDPAYEYTADIVGVLWIAFKKSSSSVGSPTREIYVGVADTNSTIYRSTNGGSSWQVVPGQPAAGYLPHHGIIASNGVLYITYSDTCGPYDGEKGDVWKYDTNSSVWTQISPVASSSSDDYFGYGGLAVDARNPDTLVVSTLNSWWPDANLYRSTNGGASWVPIWEWAGYPSRKLRYTLDISESPWLDWGGAAAEPEPKVKLGWMIGDIEIDPFNSDRMMYGTGATIYGATNLTSWDSGGTVALRVFAKGIEESAIQDLLCPPEGAALLSGMYDVNGFRHNDLTVTPSKMFLTPGFATLSLDYAAGSPGFIVRAGDGDEANGVMSVGFSYDGGANWFQGSSQPGGATKGTIAAAADASAVVWAPSGTQPQRTTDNGNSWSACQGLPNEAIVVSDRVNANKFYGISSGKFYVSTNKGQTFTATSLSGLPSVRVKAEAMPGTEGEIWVAGGDVETTGIYGLWKITNSGSSVTKLSNVQEADVVGFGAAAPGRSNKAIYTSAKISGIRGIFRSDDAGASWVRINDDLHQYGWTGSAITGDLRQYGRVFFGTNGRGIIWGERTGSSTTPPPTPTPTPVASCLLKGDVNGDGSVSIIDALMTAQYYVGLNPPNFNVNCADTNCDGIITIVDALMIAQFYVGLLSGFIC